MRQQTPASIPDVDIDLEIIEGRGVDVGGARDLADLALGGARRLLGVVHQPGQIGGRIGVAQRLVLGDLAFGIELEQRLLEAHRAGRQALLDRLLDLIGFALHDQLGDVVAAFPRQAVGSRSARKQQSSAQKVYDESGNTLLHAVWMGSVTELLSRGSGA